MTNESEKDNAVERLIEKASHSVDSSDAMRFSQAACNAANALCALKIAQKKD
jgi:hypothetical protein